MFAGLTCSLCPLKIINVYISCDFFRSADDYTDVNQTAENDYQTINRKRKRVVLPTFSDSDGDIFESTIIPHKWTRMMTPKNKDNCPSTCHDRKKKAKKTPSVRNDDSIISTDYGFLDDMSSNNENEHSGMESEETPKCKPATRKFKEKWPIFKVDDAGFFKESSRLAEIMLNPDKEIICDSVPLGCDENFSFVIDANKLKYREDITCDDTGKYTRYSYKKSDLVACDDCVYPSRAYRPIHDSENISHIKLIRRYANHMDTPGFHRTVYQLMLSNNGQFDVYHNIVILRYEWHGKKGILQHSSHGRATTNKKSLCTIT